LVAGQLLAAEAALPARGEQVLRKGVAAMVFGPYSSHRQAKGVTENLESKGYATKIVRESDGCYYVHAW
jgi:hypothetical protein